MVIPHLALVCFIPAWCILLLLFSLPQAKCAVPLNPPSQLLVDWKPSGFAQGIESRFPTFSWAVTPAEVVWAIHVKSNESSNVIFQNGFDAKRPSSLHKASLFASEDLKMQCLENMHVSSLEEFSWDAEGGESKKQTMLEALNRRCKHHKSCSLSPSSSYSAARLVWTCTENSLLSRTTYYWTVRAWYNSGSLSVPIYAEPSSFTTSLYEEWNDAVAIYGKSPSGFVYLRAEQNFTNHDSCALQAATVYATAAESNKLFSAQWIGCGPGRNNWANQQLYDSFNVFSIFQNYSQHAETPIVLAAECFHLTSGAFQLSLDFQFLCTNSSVIVTTIVSTSQKWKSFPANSIFNPTGSSAQDYIQPHEYINGMNWIDSWKEFGFDDSEWDSASLVTSFKQPLIAKSTLPVAISVVPLAHLELIDGRYFFYLEREVMGGLILTVNNTKSSSIQIEIRLGEELNGPGSVMYQMRTGNVYQDFWILKPDMNLLQHHEYMEWRYGEILNFPGELHIDDVSVWVYNYPFDDSLSSFSSSNAQLNEIYELCKYTVKATSLDLLTDSNTRERQPYEADMYITSMSLLSVMPSFPIVRATLSWLLEFPTWPTEWHLLTNAAAYLDYMTTGDLWVAENFWTILSANSFVPLYFNESLGLLDKPVDASNGIKDLVDWPAVMRDGYMMTNVDTVINAHVYHAASILASFAQLTNHTSSVGLFSNAASQIYRNVNAKLINSSGIYVDGLGVNHTAAHASAFALSFGLVDSTNYNNVVQFLLAKGMVGSPYFAHFLLDGLYSTATASGAQGAFDLILSTAENSWLAMIENGATMTAEMWNITEKPNMSWSHPWSTTPLIMITRRIMGITPLSPTFSRVLISPQPPTTSPFNASITTPTIKGPFTLTLKTVLNEDPSDGLLLYEWMSIEIEIPANVLAEVIFPFGSDKKRKEEEEEREGRGRGEGEGEGEKEGEEGGSKQEEERGGRRLVRVVVDEEEVEEVWEGRYLKMAKRLGSGRHYLRAKIIR